MLNLESRSPTKTPDQDQLKFSPVPTMDLAHEFRVSKTTVRKHIHIVLGEEPSQVRKKGDGARSRYSITPDGMNLLRKSLEENSTMGSRKKVNFIQHQDPVAPSSEPQAIVSRSPSPNPTFFETIPLYPSLTREIQRVIKRIDTLDDASLKEKRTLLTIFLWQENPSIRARKETAKILGITLEAVDETIRKKTSEEEADRLEALFKKFSKTRAPVGQNKKSRR